MKNQADQFLSTGLWDPGLKRELYVFVFILIY